MESACFEQLQASRPPLSSANGISYRVYLSCNKIQPNITIRVFLKYLIPPSSSTLQNGPQILPAKKEVHVSLNAAVGWLLVPLEVWERPQSPHSRAFLGSWVQVLCLVAVLRDSGCQQAASCDPAGPHLANSSPAKGTLQPRERRV